MPKLKTALVINKRDAEGWRIATALRKYTPDALFAPLRNTLKNVLDDCIFSIRDPGLENFDIEKRPDYLQVIPYITLGAEESGESILLFSRRSTHTEERLASNLTVGAGGHIEVEDIPTPYRGNYINTFWNCMWRELAEELPWIPITNEYERQLRGFIYTDENEVSSVHIGVHVHIPLDTAVKEYNDDLTLLDNAFYWLDMWKMEEGNNEEDLELGLKGVCIDGQAYIQTIGTEPGRGWSGNKLQRIETFRGCTPYLQLETWSEIVCEQFKEKHENAG